MSHSYLCKAGNNAERQLCASTDFIALILNVLHIKERLQNDYICTLGQLTEPFICEFHHYLLDEKGYSSGTIIIYVSLFKKMCRIAFERGLSKNLLFAHYRVGTPRVTTPKALTMSDFVKIRDIELPEDKPRLSISRDLFLFACYAGTAYIDTVSITKSVYSNAQKCKQVWQSCYQCRYARQV